MSRRVCCSMQEAIGELMSLWKNTECRYGYISTKTKTKTTKKAGFTLLRSLTRRNRKKRATTWNTRLGIVLRKTMVCILTEHIFKKDSYRKRSSREVGNWRLLQTSPTPTITSYTRTAPPHGLRTYIQVLTRPRSITSSQPRHKATWTKTAVPWKKKAQR